MTYASASAPAVASDGQVERIRRLVDDREGAQGFLLTLNVGNVQHLTSRQASRVIDALQEFPRKTVVAAETSLGRPLAQANPTERAINAYADEPTAEVEYQVVVAPEPAETQAEHEAVAREEIVAQAVQAGLDPEVHSHAHPLPEGLADNPVGRALALGKVHVTLKSLKTGEHLTLKLQGKAKVGNVYERGTAIWGVATHIFIQDAQDWQNKAGTFYPNSGKFYPAKNASPAMVFAAEQVVQYATTDEHHPRVEIVTRENCFRCGAELDDPKSIERGFGPTCWGEVTGSKHVSRRRRGAK